VEGRRSRGDAECKNEEEAEEEELRGETSSLYPSAGRSCARFRHSSRQPPVHRPRRESFPLPRGAHGERKRSAPEEEKERQRERERERERGGGREGRRESFVILDGCSRLLKFFASYLARHLPAVPGLLTSDRVGS
jgi:hypothetical protein